MFYKIVSEGEIVDVSVGLNFVRWQKRIGTFLGCNTEDEASGIVASDGSTIYLLEGAEQVNDLTYITYTEIDEETYNTLRDQLIENGVLSDSADTGSEDTESENETTQETVAKSKELKLIESLQEQVDVLTECLLEMSEAVYG
ncbi:MAG: hypothetical protein LUD19_03385 [Clostridia bacterium]|nr:hypothetical protein [Clostridia bacterium]